MFHAVLTPLRRAALATSLVLAVGIASAGCARVKPWQREKLASAVMTLPLAQPPLAVSYRSKLLESKAGGGLPGVAAGGGCGCTQ
jgi:ABC-type molybdate transport system permease subunit